MTDGRYEGLSLTRAGLPAALALALLAAVLVPLLAMGSEIPAAGQEALAEAAQAYLKPRSTATAEAALVSLLAAGPAAVPVLLRGMSGDRGRERVSRLLARLGSPAFDALFAALPDPDLGGRAATVLVDLAAPGDGRRAPAYLDCIRRLPVARASCGMALVRSLSPKAGAQASLLAAALADPDAEVRAYAAAALAQLGTKAKPTLEALKAALSDASPAVRWSAADALGGLGRGGRSAAPFLRALKDDSHPEVRRRAVAALEKVGG